MGGAQGAPKVQIAQQTALTGDPIFDQKEITVGDFIFNRDNILGKGGFGSVFKGKSKRSNKQVAIKEAVIVGNAKDKYTEKEAKMAQEIQQLSSIKDNYLVEIFLVTAISNHVFIVMELCHEDLGDYLKREGKMEEIKISSLLKQISTALKVLHQKNIIHRDMKPNNILLTKERPGAQNSLLGFIALVGDFGISRVVDNGPADATMSMIGCPVYMAPEIITGNYDFKVDIWGMGIIALCCTSSESNLVLGHILGQMIGGMNFLQIPANISAPFKQLLTGMLKRSPEERFDLDTVIQAEFLKLANTSTIPRNADADTSDSIRSRTFKVPPPPPPKPANLGGSLKAPMSPPTQGTRFFESEEEATTTVIMTRPAPTRRITPSPQTLLPSLGPPPAVINIGEYSYDTGQKLNTKNNAHIFRGWLIKDKNQAVAIKVLKSADNGQNFDTLYNRIIKGVNLLYHVNIAKYVNLYNQNNTIYCVMEYFNHLTLIDYKERHEGTISQDTCLLIGKQIANALVALQSQGLFHGRLSPSKTLFCFPDDSNDKEFLVKITGYGLSDFQKEYEEEQLKYQPPEIRKNIPLGPASDIWSLGLMLYECYTNKLPFTEIQMQTSLDHTLQPMPESSGNGHWNEDFRSLLMSMLKIEPKERITCAQLLEKELMKQVDINIKMTKVSSWTVGDAKGKVAGLIVSKTDKGEVLIFSDKRNKSINIISEDRKKTMGAGQSKNKIYALCLLSDGGLAAIEKGENERARRLEVFKGTLSENTGMSKFEHAYITDLPKDKFRLKPADVHELEPRRLLATFMSHGLIFDIRLPDPQVPGQQLTIKKIHLDQKVRRSTCCPATKQIVISFWDQSIITYNKDLHPLVTVQGADFVQSKKTLGKGKLEQQFSKQKEVLLNQLFLTNVGEILGTGRVLRLDPEGVEDHIEQGLFWWDTTGGQPLPNLVRRPRDKDDMSVSYAAWSDESRHLYAYDTKNKRFGEYAISYSYENSSTSSVLSRLASNLHLQEACAQQ